MQLIGMLDSPYVRRVAVCLQYMGVPFEHQAISVFSTFEAFKAINPVVKAPTLVCDDGVVLMDSTLILQFIESTLAPANNLWPANAADRPMHMRALSLALAACDKSVQLIYERQLRPQAAQYQPWLTRVTGQINAALAGLEQILVSHPQLFSEANHASIAAAIAWQFISAQAQPLANISVQPELKALSGTMEATPEFKQYPPFGPGVQRGT